MGELTRVGPALVPAGLLRWTAVAGAGLLLWAAFVLALRRLAGALSQPLTLPSLLLIVVVLVTAAVALRLLRRVSGPGPRLLRVEPIAGIVSVAVLLVGLSVSLPGTPWSGLAVFWLIVAAEEAWAWRHAWQRGERQMSSEPERAAPMPEPHAPAPVACDPVDHEPVSVAVDLEGPGEEATDSAVEFSENDEPPAEGVTQQVTRSRAADGSETLNGYLRVSLAPGQRNTNVHLAFCPPFARTPQISVEQLDGPETRIKVVQALPYGVRCDLKLAGVCDVPATVLLQLSVHAEPGPRPASAASEGTSAGESA